MYIINITYNKVANVGTLHVVEEAKTTPTWRPLDDRWIETSIVSWFTWVWRFRVEVVAFEIKMKTMETWILRNEKTKQDWWPTAQIQ